MSYKVSYYKLALMDDGTTGNIRQGSGIAYTDKPIEKIPESLNKHLKDKKRIAVIQEIVKVEGWCLV